MAAKLRDSDHTLTGSHPRQIAPKIPGHLPPKVTRCPAGTQDSARPDSHALSLIARGSAVGGSGSIESHLVHSAVEPGISRLTLAGPTGRALSTRKNTISQIPPNTATAPIRSVG